MTDKNPKLIETPVRFSLSKLWKIQKNYFSAMGVNAWQKEVPFYISSNAFTGYHYAHLIINFIKDWVQLYPDVNEPFYIMELGSGTGKFSFYFLKFFKELLTQYNLNKINFCYIISDVVQSNIKFCQENYQFQSYIEKGELDFTYFDIELDKDFTLLNKNQPYSTLNVKTPLIIIANYTLDCIKQDAFEFTNGKFNEVKVGLQSRYPNFNIENPLHLDDLKFDYHNEEINIENYYETPLMNDILMQYKNTLQNKDTFVLMPVGAFAFLDNISALTKDNFFMISGDKGISLLPKLPLLAKTPLMTYDGCYAFMVNFHAIGTYFQYQGGDYIPTKNGNSFKVNLFSRNLNFSKLNNTKTYFENFIETTGPDEYCYIYQEFFCSSYRFSLKSLLSFLRFSHWDPLAYAAIHDKAVELCLTNDLQLMDDFIIALKKVEENIYDINMGADVYTLLGIFYQIKGLDQEALRLYQKAMTVFKDNPAPYNNSAKIYEKQRNIPKAILLYEQSYKLDKRNKFAKRKFLQLTGKPYVAAMLPVLKAALVLIVIGFGIYQLMK